MSPIPAYDPFMLTSSEAGWIARTSHHPQQHPGAPDGSWLERPSLQPKRRTASAGFQLTGSTFPLKALGIQSPDRSPGYRCIADPVLVIKDGAILTTYLEGAEAPWRCWTDRQWTGAHQGAGSVAEKLLANNHSLTQVFHASIHSSLTNDFFP